MTLMMYYIGLIIYIYIYIYTYILFFMFVVKTHLCSYFPHDGWDYYDNRQALTINVWAMDCCISFTQETVVSDFDHRVRKKQTLITF